jgi:hypothetical protein
MHRSEGEKFGLVDTDPSAPSNLSGTGRSRAAAMATLRSATKTLRSIQFGEVNVDVYRIIVWPLGDPFTAIATSDNLGYKRTHARRGRLR